MKKLLFSAAVAVFCLGANAQDLPQPSPKSEFHQRIGLTDIKVEYSRPSAKGREIFGGLVPYEELWRTGANKATAVTFSTPVLFGGEEVPAGTYSVFTIPGSDQWTVILNSETELWGTDGYSEDNDVARATVEPMYVDDKLETFTIDIQNLRNESALMVMAWDNTRVGIPLEVRTMEKAEENIALALEETPEEDMWRIYRNSANFYLNNNANPDLALKYINASIAQNRDNWYSYLVKAEILAAQNQYEEAIKSATMALEVGEKMAKKEKKEFGYANMIAENIKNWKTKKG